jgi:hypothetical protein
MMVTLSHRCSKRMDGGAVLLSDAHPQDFKNGRGEDTRDVRKVRFQLGKPASGASPGWPLLG